MGSESNPMTASAARVVRTLPPSEDWAALIGRAAAHDPEALAALYDGTSHLAYGLVLRIVGDPSAAEEVTGDVYLQVWRQAARYDPSRGAPLAWLLTLARSRAIDRRRSTGSGLGAAEPLTAAGDVASRSPGPEEASVLAERRRMVRGALGRLAADQRRAIELAYFSGLTHGEIASALDEPLGTVKTRIRLGMIRLREMLAWTGKDLL
jgi:RNA polymerase sigma-70 factor (ECF subfamily)